MIVQAFDHSLAKTGLSLRRRAWARAKTGGGRFPKNMQGARKSASSLFIIIQYQCGTIKARSFGKFYERNSGAKKICRKSEKAAFCGGRHGLFVNKTGRRNEIHFLRHAEREQKRPILKAFFCSIQFCIILINSVKIDS